MTDTHFVYDGNQIILQLDDAGAVTNRYLWGKAVDQILADEQVHSDGTSEVLWPLTDHLNTVRDLAVYDADTDLTTIANHLVYDAFGRVTSQTDPTITTLFGFTARPFDPDTGLQNNLNRWYDAEVGRWLSEDPIGFTAADANLYRYVGNKVTLGVDPTGLDWRTWWEGTKGFFAGGGQGGINIVNGLQDTVIGIANLPGAAVNGIAYVEEKVGILDPNDSMRVPYIPSPDWSRDLITEEGGEGWSDTHNWSKGLGAGGVEILTGTAVAKAAKARAAARAAREEAAFNEFFRNPMRDPPPNIPPYNSRMPRFTAPEPLTDYIPPDPRFRPGSPPPFSNN